MKKILITFLIFSIIRNNARAQSTQPIVATSGNDVVLIEKGVETPFKGYLFPPDKALNFRKQLLELDQLKGLESSYEKSVELYKKNEDITNFKINTLLIQNDKLSDALYKQKDRDVWSDRIWFVLGIAITGTSVYLATRLR